MLLLGRGRPLVDALVQGDAGRAAGSAHLKTGIGFVIDVDRARSEP
jgi:hypothetical protein